MQELTKEQLEIIEFTREEFGKSSLEDQDKMYLAVAMVASIKWPEHSQKFYDAYASKWLVQEVK